MLLGSAVNMYCVAIDSSSPQTVYTGSFDGGVYKSTNGGGNWTAANSGLMTFDIFSIRIDPARPQMLYVGTGQGVYKSTDGAGNWTAINRGLGCLGVNSLAAEYGNVVHPAESLTRKLHDDFVGSGDRCCNFVRHCNPAVSALGFNWLEIVGSLRHRAS
jgi:hypothetical protein